MDVIVVKFQIIPMRILASAAPGDWIPGDCEEALRCAVLC